MKKLYFLSALSIFNFALVVIIANSAHTTNTQKVMATPQAIITKVVKKVQKVTNGVTSQTPANQPANTTTTNSNACIVTVDGVKYDFTIYKDLHSGGNVFTCGADMSSTFWSQHSQRQLNQMQRYKI